MAALLLGLLLLPLASGVYQPFPKSVDRAIAICNEFDQDLCEVPRCCGLLGLRLRFATGPHTDASHAGRAGVLLLPKRLWRGALIAAAVTPNLPDGAHFFAGALPRLPLCTAIAVAAGCLCSFALK